MQITSIVNQALTLLVVFAQAVVVLIILFKPVRAYVSKRAILFAFIVSLTATLGSLFYSEIAGYEPCKLCWFQRIFMYPQPVLYAIALSQKDKSIIKYGFALSIIGGLIALYHYLLQVGVVPNGACGAVGYSVSCSQRFVMEFGYITIPMMSLTTFAYIIAILLTSRKSTS